MKKGFFAFALFMVVLASCDMGSFTSLPEDFDLGTTENNVYTNKYFNLEMQLPENWALQSREELESLMQLGATLYEEDSEMKKLIKAADVRSATLLGMFKYPLDSLVTFNSSLLLVAENVRLIRTIKTGKDYLDEAKKLLKKSTLEYEIEEEYEQVTISGRDFYIMSVSTSDELIGTIKQQYFTTLVRGFALSAIVSYTLDEDQAELHRIVQNITFKKEAQ